MDRIHSLVWAIKPHSIALNQMSIARIDRTSRKIGKQKSTLLRSRTTGRKVFSTPTPGQQLLIDKAKRQTIVF